MEKINLPDGVFNRYHIDVSEKFFGVTEWKFGSIGFSGDSGFRGSVYGCDANGKAIIDVTFDSSGGVRMYDLREKPVDFKLHIESDLETVAES